MYNNGNKEPSKMAQIMLKVPGGTFEDKIKFCMGFVYVVSAIFYVIAILMMFNTPLKTKIACAYKVDTYDCRVFSKSLLRDLNILELPDITQAVAGNIQTDPELKQSAKGPMYQLQLVDINNNRIKYTDTWLGNYTDVEKQVVSLNKLFHRNRNFNYDFGMKVFVIISILIMLAIPTILISWFRNNFGNYVYEKISVYNPVLQNKSIGNMTNSSMGTLMGHFGREKKQNVYNMPANSKEQNFKAKEYNGPSKADIEVAKNLQDDDMTDIQKDFYDRNN